MNDRCIAFGHLLTRHGFAIYVMVGIVGVCALTVSIASQSLYYGPKFDALDATFDVAKTNEDIPTMMRVVSLETDLLQHYMADTFRNMLYGVVFGFTFAIVGVVLRYFPWWRPEGN